METRTITREVKITDDDIKKAICLKANACFNTLLFCRALGSAGFEDNEWYLARNFTLKELVAEALRRQIDLSGLVTSVERTLLSQSMKFKHALGLVSDAELDRWWRDVKDGKVEP